MLLLNSSKLCGNSCNNLCARQDFAWQFPEAALVRSVRSGEKVRFLWGWLCDQWQAVKYDLMLEWSIGWGKSWMRKNLVASGAVGPIARGDQSRKIVVQGIGSRTRLPPKPKFRIWNFKSRIVRVNLEVRPINLINLLSCSQKVYNRYTNNRKRDHDNSRSHPQKTWARIP